MLGALKKTVQGTAGMAGLQIQKVKREPFHELWDVPRFTEHRVKLLDRSFLIADSRSFFFSYREIFVEEIYRFNTSRAKPRIIDCGSNYGTSIVYLKNLYPNAKVTGIEADPKIFSLLTRNCSHLREVLLVNGAVSDSREPVTFYSEGSDGGRTTHPIERPKIIVTIKSVLLDDLIDGPVDFLKVDIEGAEFASLLACKKLSMVQNLFVEYHCFKGHPQVLGDLLNLLKANGFRYYIRDQFCSTAPLTQETEQLGMDLQLNIFAKRT